MERKRRRWPWIVAGVLGVLIVTAAVALPPLLDVERYRGRIEAALTQATGWNAELGQIGFSVWRGLVLTVSPVRLIAPGDTSRADVETLEIRAAVWPLLRGRLEVKSIDLIRPKIALVRKTRAGGWILPGRGGRTKPPAPSAPPSTESAPPVNVTIGRVRISDGALALDDRANEPPFKIALASVGLDIAPSSYTIAGTARLEPGGGLFEVSGSLDRGLAITVTDLPTESLHPFLGSEMIHAGGTLSGQAQVTLPPAIHGRIAGRSITLLAGEKPMDELRAEFDVRAAGPAWRLENLALDAQGLRVTGQGSLLPAIDLRFTLAAPLEAVLAAAPSILPLPLDLRPPGSVSADLRIQGPEGQPLATTATGKLSAAEFIVAEAVPPAKDVQAEFELYKDGSLEVRILGGTIAGGPARGTARLASIDPPGKLTFDGGLEDAAFGALLKGFVAKAESITGPTGLDAKVGLDLSRPTIDARALSGRLDLDSRDVRFPGFDLDQAVLKKLEEKLGPLAALAALTGRTDPTTGTATSNPKADRDFLKQLTASVDFDRWPWGLERLGFDADGLAAQGTGTFDPEKGTVALDLIARLSPERTRRLVEKTKQLSRLVGPDGRLALPLKVKGALLSPSVEVDLGKALTVGGATKEEAIQGILEGLLDRRNKKKPQPTPQPSP
jgi:AsmA family/AsmA-like C-terminal region